MAVGRPAQEPLLVAKALLLEVPAAQAQAGIERRKKMKKTGDVLAFLWPLQPACPSQRSETYVNAISLALTGITKLCRV